MEPQVIGGPDFLSALEGAPECLIEKLVRLYPDLPERHPAEDGKPSRTLETLMPHLASAQSVPHIPPVTHNGRVMR